MFISQEPESRFFRGGRRGLPSRLDMFPTYIIRAVILPNSSF